MDRSQENTLADDVVVDRRYIPSHRAPRQLTHLVDVLLEAEEQLRRTRQILDDIHEVLESRDAIGRKLDETRERHHVAAIQRAILAEAAGKDEKISIPGSSGPGPEKGSVGPRIDLDRHLNDADLGDELILA